MRRNASAATGGVQIEELASAMGQTGQFGDLGTEERLVAAVVVDHQVAAPALQEVPRMRPAAAALVVEHDDRGAPCSALLR